MRPATRRVALFSVLALLNSGICTAQGQATTPAAGPPGGKYVYRMLVGRKNETALRAALGTVPELADFKEFEEKWRRLPTTRSVCAAFNKSGHYFQTRATDVSASDEIVILAARWKVDTKPEETCELIRHLYWEFQISRRWTWTRLEFPTLWSYAPDSKTAKALPVAAASGLRLGLPVEFPRYLDFTLFGAPAFKLKSDSSSADVTSFTY